MSVTLCRLSCYVVVCRAKSHRIYMTLCRPTDAARTAPRSARIYMTLCRPTDAARTAPRSASRPGPTRPTDPTRPTATLRPPVGASPSGWRVGRPTDPPSAVGPGLEIERSAPWRDFFQRDPHGTSDIPTCRARANKENAPWTSLRGPPQHTLLRRTSPRIFRHHASEGKRTKRRLRAQTHFRASVH